MTGHTLSRHNPPCNDLTAEYVRSILDYNPETGEFRWKYRPEYPRKWNTRYTGKVAGNLNKPTNRIFIRIEGQNLLAHRIAWLYMTGDWPVDQIDHIDCNSSNNKFHNLRECTSAQNGANKRGRGGVCGLKGVDYHKRINKFRARIRSGGVQVHLGAFDTAEDAHAAYCAAVHKFHGEFSRTG